MSSLRSPTLLCIVQHMIPKNQPDVDTWRICSVPYKYLIFNADIKERHGDYVRLCVHNAQNNNKIGMKKPIEGCSKKNMQDQYPAVHCKISADQQRNPEPQRASVHSRRKSRIVSASGDDATASFCTLLIYLQSSARRCPYKVHHHHSAAHEQLCMVR